MKNIKDFLKILNGIITVPEIEGWIAASDLNAVEVSGEAAKTLSESVKGLLTEEAAKNNVGLKAHFKSQMMSSLKGELYGNVDTQLHTTVRDVFGDEALEKVEAAEYTKDKLKILHDIIIDHQSKKADDKTKLMVDGLKKQLDKNQESYDRKMLAKDDEIKKLNEGANEKLVYSDLMRRISSKKFAENFNEDDMKSILSKTAIDRIKKEAVIKLSEQGELLTYNPESPEMELFNEDGKKMNVDSLIEKHIGKYLAKSEPERIKTEAKIPEKQDKGRIYADPEISSLGKAIASGR